MCACAGGQCVRRRRSRAPAFQDSISRQLNRKCSYIWCDFKCLPLRDKGNGFFRIAIIVVVFFIAYAIFLLSAYKTNIWKID